MRQKLSITIDEQSVKEIDAKLKEGFFRSKSHFIEYAVKEMLQK